LLDVSPLYKYMVRGRDAERLLDRIVTRNMTKCAVGQVVYTPWCDDHGKVLDDGTVSRLDETVFRVTAAEPNLDWLHQNARGMSVEIEDVSDSLAAVALQGPLARDILKEVVDGDVGGLRFFRVMSANIRDVPVTISRTGYTGDLGYEIWIDAPQAERVWDALMDAGRGYGITPAGILALDVARIEAGLILIDVDYVPAKKAVVESRKSSPYELNLGWTVKLNGGPFVGREALSREAHTPSGWHLRGLEIEWESLEELYAASGLPPQLPGEAWRTSVPVYASGTQVGYATSGCWSPSLKQYIALAHLRDPSARSGTDLLIEVTVEHQRRHARARVAELPFFDPPRKRE